MDKNSNLLKQCTDLEEFAKMLTQYRKFKNNSTVNSTLAITMLFIHNIIHKKMAPAATYASLQKLWSDPGVNSDGPSDFWDISTSSFTDGWYGVDAGDSLGQECIRCLDAATTRQMISYTYNTLHLYPGSKFSPTLNLVHCEKKQRWITHHKSECTIRSGQYIFDLSNMSRKMLQAFSQITGCWLQ